MTKMAATPKYDKIDININLYYDKVNLCLPCVYIGKCVMNSFKGEKADNHSDRTFMFI